MSLNAYDVSAGVFVRGLTNLRMQLMKAESHVAANGGDEATLLGARLARDGQTGNVASGALEIPVDAVVGTTVDHGAHEVAEVFRIAHADR